MKQIDAAAICALNTYIMFALLQKMKELWNVWLAMKRKRNGERGGENSNYAVYAEIKKAAVNEGGSDAPIII